MKQNKNGLMGSELLYYISKLARLDAQKENLASVDLLPFLCFLLFSNIMHQMLLLNHELDRLI